MNKLACQYAVIRFLPYAETGEFANVGVVLACPAAGYFGTCLMPTKKTGRIAAFFEQLEKRIYRDAMTYLKQDLARIDQFVQDRCRDASCIQRTFAELVRPREGLLRFGETRAILAERPDETLKQLFATFVERDFADKKYHDQLLEREIRETLRRAKLREFFQEGKIGNSDLYMRVPFAHERAGRTQLAIKPVDLAKHEAKLVYDVGGPLVDRVKRLRKHNLLPDALLFTVRLPGVTEVHSLRAAQEILGDLRDNNIVRAVPSTDTNAVTDFARGAASN